MTVSFNSAGVGFWQSGRHVSFLRGMDIPDSGNRVSRREYFRRFRGTSVGAGGAQR